MAKSLERYSQKSPLTGNWQGCKCRRSDPEVFSGKGVLRICSTLTGENPR